MRETVANAIDWQAEATPRAEQIWMPGAHRQGEGVAVRPSFQIRGPRGSPPRRLFPHNRDNRRAQNSRMTAISAYSP